MKVAFTENPTYDKEAKAMKAHADAILPLRFEKDTKLAKDQYTTFKLRTDPTSANSPTYDYVARHVTGDEGTRYALRYRKDLETIWRGHNVTTVAGKLPLARQLLKGEALSAFNRGLEARLEDEHRTLRTQAWETARAAGATAAAQAAAAAAVARPAPNGVVLEAALRSVVEYMTPAKALTRVKRYLRRFCRKPVDMSVREYFNALQRINNEEIPNLPPFGGDHQKLSMDEIMEIIHFGIPNSWKREMEVQGFDFSGRRNRKYDGVLPTSGDSSRISACSEGQVE
jgi:hypothetical protein